LLLDTRRFVPVLSPYRILVAVLLAALPCVAAAQSKGDDAVDTASVSGRVTLDGEPVANVTVRAYRASGGSFDARDRAKTTTDDEGRYRLTGLPSGQIVVSPRTPALVGSRGRGMHPGGVVVTLADGEALEDLEIPLVRGGVLTGKIVDQDGRPVIGLQVRAVLVEESLRSESTMGRTDDRGIYRLFGLPAGRYLLEAGLEGPALPGAGALAYLRTYYPGTTDEGQATRLDVSAGAELRSVDFAVRRAAAGFAVEGRVVNAATGRPVPSVFVVCNPETPSPTMYSGAPVATDGRGAFRIVGLSPGRYTAVTFTAAGASAELYSEPVAFEVAGANVTGLEIRLLAGSRIRGTVVVDGEPSARGGVDYSALRVYCRARSDEGSHGVVAPIAPARVAADGSFELVGVRPGRAMIGVSRMGGGPQPTTLRVEKDGVPAEEGVDVGAGEVVTGVRILVAQGTASVRGKLTVTGGTLATGAGLAVVARPTGPDASSRGHYSAVDARQQFVLEGLVEGEYEVMAMVVPGAVSDPSAPQPQVSKRVRVAADQTVEVALELDLSGREVPGTP
jgi:hypothetical protein